MPQRSCRPAVAATRLLGDGSLQLPAHAWHRHTIFVSTRKYGYLEYSPSSSEGNAEHSVYTPPRLILRKSTAVVAAGAATARDLPRDEVIRAKCLAAANVVLDHRLQTNAPRASHCVVVSLIMTHKQTYTHKQRTKAVPDAGLCMHSSKQAR